MKYKKKYTDAKLQYQQGAANSNPSSPAAPASPSKRKAKGFFSSVGTSIKNNAASAVDSVKNAAVSAAKAVANANVTVTEKIGLATLHRAYVFTDKQYKIFRTVNADSCSTWNLRNRYQTDATDKKEKTDKWLNHVRNEVANVGVLQATDGLNDRAYEITENYLSNNNNKLKIMNRNLSKDVNMGDDKDALVGEITVKNYKISMQENKFTIGEEITNQLFDFDYDKYDDRKMLLNIIYAANDENKPDGGKITDMEEPYTHIVVVGVYKSLYGCGNEIKNQITVDWKTNTFK
jgi:hypothetical protein